LEFEFVSDFGFRISDFPSPGALRDLITERAKGLTTKSQNQKLFLIALPGFFQRTWFWRCAI
jgi:hypothetical protein